MTPRGDGRNMSSVSQCSERVQERSSSLSRQLELYLPKFSIEGSYQLEKVLPKLGIRDVFTSHADLTGISNHSSIQVSEVSPEASEQLLSEIPILSYLILSYLILSYPILFHPVLSHSSFQILSLSLSSFPSRSKGFTLHLNNGKPYPAPCLGGRCLV